MTSSTSRFSHCATASAVSRMISMYFIVCSFFVGRAPGAPSYLDVEPRRRKSTPATHFFRRTSCWRPTPVPSTTLDTSPTTLIAECNVGYGSRRLTPTSSCPRHRLGGRGLAVPKEGWVIDTTRQASAKEVNGTAGGGWKGAAAERICDGVRSSGAVRLLRRRPLPLLHADRDAVPRPAGAESYPRTRSTHCVRLRSGLAGAGRFGRSGVPEQGQDGGRRHPRLTPAGNPRVRARSGRPARVRAARGRHRRCVAGSDGVHHDGAAHPVRRRIASRRTQVCAGHGSALGGTDGAVRAALHRGAAP